MTDTIDIKLIEEDNYNDYVQIILNGEPLKRLFDVYGFIATTYKKKITVELCTCSCGVPGCAGIFYGTTSKRRRKTVEWRDIDSGLPKRFYSFKREDYDAAIKNAIDAMYKVALKRESLNMQSFDTDDDELEYDGRLTRHDLYFTFSNVKELESYLNYHYWY